MTVCREWTLTADRRFTGLCTLPLTAVTENDTKQCVVCVDPVFIGVTHGTYDVTDYAGNWEVPAGIYEVTVKINGAGAGGGGGRVAGGGNGGSGGGGGGYREIVLAVTPGDLIPYIRGAGGTGGTGGNPGSNGTAGGASSILSGTYIANGGDAGLYESAASVAGGTSTGGMTGGSGGGNSGSTGGSGGSSPNGGASVAGTVPNSGPALNGNDPGGGGAGGAGGVNGNGGGTGADGRVRFIW